MHTHFLFRLFLLFVILFSVAPAGSMAQKKTKKAAAVAKFVKTATGIYDSQKSIITLKVDTVATPHFRRQQIICYPIWQSQSGTDAWLYFGWFSPMDKENALEEVFLRIYEQNGKLLADWYEIPEEQKMLFSQEWLKSEPFAAVAPRDLIENREKQLFATCEVKADKAGFMMKASERGEFKIATPAAYKYMFVEMGFYPDGYTSGSQFIAADGKTVVIAHEHRFKMEKVSKKYNKF